MVLYWLLAVPVGLLAVFYKMSSSYNEDLFLGVYQPVPLSTYSPIYPANPDPHVKEIAELYTSLLRLFISMRYLREEHVHFPPHNDPSINLTQLARYGFVKDVADLYQTIPHVTGGPTNWNMGSDGGEFLMWGELIPDLRDIPRDDGEIDQPDWEQILIDPEYALDLRESEGKIPSQMGWKAENGPYIRPEYAVLGSCGNHGSTLILNTNNWHIWLKDQLGGGSTDPFFTESGHTHISKTTPNRNDLTQFPSRPATEFFQDIIARFHSLRWIPGGLYSETDREYPQFKQIYFQAGWPDSFDGALFDKLRAEMEEAKDLFHHQTDALNRLDSHLQHDKRIKEWKSELPSIESEIKRLETNLRSKELSSAETDQLQRQLDGARERHEKHLENVAPTPDQWARWQDQLSERKQERERERQVFLYREGRFSGMTDEEHAQAVRTGWFDDEIQELEVLLADGSAAARNARIEDEVRAEARGVAADLRERWLVEQRRWAGKDAVWEVEFRAWFDADRDVNYDS